MQVLSRKDCLRYLWPPFQTIALTLGLMLFPTARFGGIVVYFSSQARIRLWVKHEMQTLYRQHYSESHYFDHDLQKLNEEWKIFGKLKPTIYTRVVVA